MSKTRLVKYRFQQQENRMAIYTMTGTEVQVVGGDFNKGEVDVIGYGRKPNEIKEVWINQLRADNGLTEIEQAIAEVTS